MSNSDEWVSHNLQRQRKILEEKQRQRRMQATGGVYSSSSAAHQNQSATATGYHSPFMGSNFSTNSQSRAGTSESRATPTNSSSLYSFVDRNGGGQQTRSPIRNASSSAHDMVKQRSFTVNSREEMGHEGPKIITVKGITPPHSRKQSLSDEEDTPLVYGQPQQQQRSSRPRTAPRQSSAPSWGQQSSFSGTNANSNTNSRGPVPHKPVVNVSRLEAINRADSGGFINSEAEEDSLNTTSTRNSRKTKAKDVQHVSENGRKDSVRPTVNHHPWEDEDEDESIPTEVLDDESPVEVADIVNNLDQFVMEPTKKNVTLKCKITRDKKGVDKGMFPIYYLHLEKSDGRRVFLLAARRRKKSATANYLISTDPTDLSRNAKSFIAKVRSNAMGTSFTIYDHGENPKKASVIGDGIRQELAAVIYETNVLGLKGPRKMTIIIPGIYSDEKHNYVRPIIVRPISEKDSILERHRTHRLDEMVVLNNKQPVWNEDTQSYVLNFHGRVTQASVKNFQIVHCLNNAEEEQQNNRNSSQPLANNSNSPYGVKPPISNIEPAEYIAFGIAMSSFHDTGKMTLDGKHKRDVKLGSSLMSGCSSTEASGRVCLFHVMQLLNRCLPKVAAYAES
uniref:Tubby C-terminal domain-containing protein n=1 Tax=Ditylenchus dipsaci TaxID=166011 RepID=A0A915CNZ3_9BILA